MGNGRRATIRITDHGRTLHHVPLDDIILHSGLRVTTENNVHAFRFFCRDCKGRQRKTIEVIRQHHAAVGRDLFLQKSLVGGDQPEGYPPHGLWFQDVACDDNVVENMSWDT